MELLDEYSPSLDDDQKTKVIKDNFRRLGTAIQFMGAEIIANVQGAGVQTVSSATYVTLGNYNGSFQCSGGLIVIVAYLFGQVNNDNIIYSLQIDGQQVMSQWAIGSSSAVNATSTLFWAGQMVAGKHTVVIQAKNTTGTVTIGNTSYSSGYYVLEFRKG